MVKYNPIPLPPNQRKIQLFQNKGEDNIRITYLRFQSSAHPRKWDAIAHEQNILVLGEGDVCELEIAGPGEIFIKWRVNSKERADHFVLQYDDNGVPYPYIFGGDRWTMALRRAALGAGDGKN